jgi:hypothetical protein
MSPKMPYNGCEHEQCGFGANQLSLTTNLVGTTHFHNQKTSIAYACCYRLPITSLEGASFLHSIRYWEYLYKSKFPLEFEMCHKRISIRTLIT